ncbi:MAG: hypothetical protein AAGF28_08215 [Pseudomonadota bacterium]
MKQVFAFDVDGTLTAPRQPIDKDFESSFRCFLRSNTVFLITGSDRGKISEQLPEDLMAMCEGLFTCSGAELWRGSDLVYRKRHSFPGRLIEAAEHFIDNSPYPVRCGNHIEPRPGMLNISVVGRNASLEQRRAYHDWERTQQERSMFVASLLAEFPAYEASTGGEISIDIVPRGWTKAVARAEIEKRVPGCAITFFGDKMDTNGNDKPLADELEKFRQHRAIPVKTYKDTWEVLRSIESANAA